MNTNQPITTPFADALHRSATLAPAFSAKVVARERRRRRRLAERSARERAAMTQAQHDRHAA